MITTKYNHKLIFGLMAGVAASVLLSMFILQLTAAALFILYLTEKNTEKKKAFGIPEIIFTAFIFFRLLSIAFSEYPAVSVSALHKYALSFLSFYSFSFYFKAITRDESQKLVLVFSGFSVITALTGIIRFNLGMVHRASSIVSGYATYSTYMLAAIPVLFLLYGQLDDKQKKYMWPAAAGLVFSGLILAMSRADLTAGIIVLLASVFYSRPKFIAVIFFLLITSAVSLVSFHNNSREVENRIEKISTTSDRNILWGNAFRKAGDHPFLGFGPKTFPVIFDERDKLGDKEVGGWHNEYISVYIESGIFALMSLLSLAGYVPIFAAGRILKKRNEENSRTVFLLFMCIAGMLMSAFFSGVFADPLLSVLFSFLLGWYFSDRAKSDPAYKTA